MALVPQVNATGGVIETLSISGDGEIGEGPISLNITMTGVGGASSASVNWNVTLTDENGSIIDYDNGNVLVNDGSYSYVETTVGNAPLGYSNLSIVITGDVGTPGQGQYTNYSTIIQRLRPLEISVAEPTINPVDANGNPTGNFTVNDGDYAKIEVPIINSGDVPWNGSLNLSLDSIELGEQSVNISGDSTEIVSFTTQQLTEGIHFVNVSLNGTQDSDSSDDTFQSTFLVGPPPLPEIQLNLERITQPAPGNAMEWVLHANNTGESDFSGVLLCSIDGVEFFSNQVNISTGGYSNYTVSTNSKPGQVVCTTSGARTSSTTNATDSVQMISAIFVGAGHSTPSILGGPWHAGDDITLSLLLRNEGDAIGTAHLEIEISGVLQDGPIISLDSGKAGEVSHSFSVASSGDKLVNWSIVSEDGVVDSNLSGSISIPVLDSQVIVFEIESVDVEDEGVVISWSAELSEGKDRLVNLKFGAIQDGLKSDAIIEERLLLPGITYGDVNIGFQDGQEVYIDLAEIEWTIGFSSFTDDEAQMPSFEINPQITVNPNTQPRVPSVGSKVTVYYTLTNIATGSVPQGQIVVTDASGEILGSDTSPEVISGSIDHSTVVNWPDGENVKISVTWYVGGKSVSDDVLVNSEKVESEDEGFEIPWGGILGGLALGMVVIFAVRIKNSPAGEKKEKKPKSTKVSASKEEKIEVACPTCDRRLRVPNTYTGAVRCPECETKFDVEAKVETPIPEEKQQQEEKITPSKELFSSSDNDILGCPKCTRKLKVPYDKRPAKARCPACSTIFEARKG
jgi:uncharacterized protein YbaR (Trm112 family)